MTSEEMLGHLKHEVAQSHLRQKTALRFGDSVEAENINGQIKELEARVVSLERSLDLIHSCPICGYNIPPREVLHVDGERIRCPKCGYKSAYGQDR